MCDNKRIRIIVGHYGSGKTEFSLNYSIKLSQANKKIALIDLDVINFYFRSRDKEKTLQKFNIELIGSLIRNNTLDLPAVSPEIYKIFEDKTYNAILDIGGDPAGARTLARYKDYLVKEKYDMFFILNKNRPQTNTKDKVIKYIKEIEKITSLKVTGIISNANLINYTTIDDILDGYELSKEVSEQIGIPIKYIVIANTLEEEVENRISKNLKDILFPINLYMREEWMV